MRKTLLLPLLLVAPFGCGDDQPKKAPPAAQAVAKQFLTSVKDKSAEGYCATFLPSTRYGTVMGHEQDLCLQLAQAWMGGGAGDEQVIDAGEIKLAGYYLKHLGDAQVEVLRRGRVIYHFDNGGKLVLEEEQGDPSGKTIAWKVDVDASGFTGP